MQSDELVDATMGDIYQKTGNAGDYGNWDSEYISGNRYISCIASLEISKIDRDYSIFGMYDVKLGSRVYASTAATDFVSLGEYDTTYMLEEPEYESSTTSLDELNYLPIDHKSWDIDVKTDLGFDGRGSQNLYIELIASPLFTEDDIVRVYMDLDLPEQALTNGTIVYQYIQLLANGATAGTDDYISVGCGLTVGEEGSQWVDNYQGTTKLDKSATAGQTVESQNDSEKDIERVFREWTDPWAWYGTWETGTGNKVSSCVVEMPIPKGEGRDEDIFLEYLVSKGAKLYKSLEDTDPSQIAEERTKIDLGEANYDADDFIDADILDLFEVDEED